MDQALLQLAEAVGIAPQYWDISGERHDAPEDSLRALLRAMGLDADHPADCLGDLAHGWGVMLSPVHILYTADAKAVPLKLPANRNTKLSWQIMLEMGGSLSGEGESDALVQGATRHVDGRNITEYWLPLPDMPMGYHELALEVNQLAQEGGDFRAFSRLIVSPGRGYLPAKTCCTGVSAQLYALCGESGANGGIGDFADLTALTEKVAAAGADALGLNPLHALFAEHPEEASPYCPASRLFYNPLYIHVPGLNLPWQELVGYRKVADVKFRALQERYDGLRHAPDSQEMQDFQTFMTEGGEELRRFCAYQALSERFHSHDWRGWAPEFRNPGSALAGFSQVADEDRLQFHGFMQWLCTKQLAGAGEAAKGMAIGLYNDLAVSVNAASMDCWAHQDLFARDIRIGAPPDPFNMAGQEWGVVPMLPNRMRATAYRHFSALLQANMRHAGALRIDHVMGWTRLFLIPAGGTPADGAYVSYPADDLFAIATLESTRNQCLLIGEDLGTVPDGYRERMAANNMLSCKVFWFERDGVTPCPPENFPELAATSVATHDLATLAGYLSYTDIKDKVRAGLIGPEKEAPARSERAMEIEALLSALLHAGLLPAGYEPEHTDVPVTRELIDAVHLYLARAPSRILLVQLDDLLAQPHQTNMPGTTEQYPNWRYRHPADGLDAAMASLKAITGART